MLPGSKMENEIITGLAALGTTVLVTGFSNTVKRFCHRLLSDLEKEN